MTETIKTLREALERLLNDAPSLSREYLRTTCDDKPDAYTICGFYKKDWLRANDARDFALAALSRLEAEQPGSSTSEPTPPVECPAAKLIKNFAGVLGADEGGDILIQFDSMLADQIRKIESSPCPPCQRCDSLREQLKEAVEVMRPFAVAWNQRFKGFDRSKSFSLICSVADQQAFARASELVARIEKEQKNA